MEGNDCYKFSTIRNYIQLTSAAPIRIAVDIGANVGNISLLMRAYFPDAAIYAFEAVPEYFEIARSAIGGTQGIRIFNRAISAEHLFADDFGVRPHPAPVPLRLLKALPEGGPGWGGGSMVVRAATAPAGQRIYGYAAGGLSPRPLSLDRLVRIVLRREHASEIDLVKFDCEGCEHSSLGCAKPETLRAVRFFVGEYHGIERFYNVMKRTLFATHKVNLIGDRDLGAFFAERRCANDDGILLANNEGMLIARPNLSPTPLEWHLFNPRFVLPGERACHALP